jgi:hypothetical protein
VKAILRQVTVLSGDSLPAFHGIRGQVRGGCGLIHAVGLDLEGPKFGDAVLLAGIGDLRLMASRLSDAGRVMRGANDTKSGAISQLLNMASRMNGNIAEFPQGAREINGSVHAILRMTEENRELIGALEAETAHFFIN